MRGMFKKTNYIRLDRVAPPLLDHDKESRDGQVSGGSITGKNGVEIPEGLWMKCPHCRHAVYKKDLE